MSAWDDLPVVGPIGHGAPDWCSVHGDIPGDMSIVAHINATHDMTYEEYRALDQMRADRTGFDSFDDARRFKTGEVALPAPDERQAGLRYIAACPECGDRFDVTDGTEATFEHVCGVIRGGSLTPGGNVIGPKAWRLIVALSEHDDWLGAVLEVIDEAALSAPAPAQEGMSQVERDLIQRGKTDPAAENERARRFPAQEERLDVGRWAEQLALVIAKARFGPGVDMGGRHNPRPSEVKAARQFMEDVAANPSYRALGPKEAKPNG